MGNECSNSQQKICKRFCPQFDAEIHIREDNEESMWIDKAFIGINSNKHKYGSYIDSMKIVETRRKLNYNETQTKSYLINDMQPKPNFNLTNSRHSSNSKCINFNSIPITSDGLQFTVKKTDQKLSTHECFDFESNIKSLQSDFKTLSQHSKFPYTPQLSARYRNIQNTPQMREKFNNFLISMDKEKFLNSNQNQQKLRNDNYYNFLNATYRKSKNLLVQNGEGELLYDNGDVLRGVFVNHKINGQGQYIKKDGSIYSGNFQNGQAQGYGLYSGSDGCRYEGQWKNNRPHGQGKIIHQDHSVYVGQMEKGLKHGKGKFIQSGCVFDGQFIQDKLEGYGKFIGDNGQTYKGEWKDNKKHGYGQFRWPNGDWYLGHYINDRRQGLGTMHYGNGETYEGQWKNGMKQGRGVYTSINGIISGIWLRSNLIKQD